MSDCLLCGSDSVISQNIICKTGTYKNVSKNFDICPQCSFIRVAGNVTTYMEQLASNEQEQRYCVLRNAGSGKHGREYFMATMCMEIFGKRNCSITFFGAGLNTDYRAIEEQFSEVQTKLADLENLQNASNFEHISNTSPSDIVIACEVLEHFNNPTLDMPRLINTMKPNGLICTSTNVYDGSSIAMHEYPFVEGHCAYWSPLALAYAAEKHNCHVDFRLPYIALRRGGPRKRYIFFFKDPLIGTKIKLYFGSHALAPSEAE